MAATYSLDSSAQLSPISVDTKCEILCHLLDLNVRPSTYYENGLDHDVYFAYYSEQCSDALHDGGRHVSVRTHRDIIEIAQHLKSSLDRKSIKQILSSKLSVPKPANEDELLNGSIDLVATLLLMVGFGCLQYGFKGRRQVEWTANSLEECIGKHFDATTVLGEENVKLEPIFNARNLGRTAGIEIEWTNNLANHLSLVDEDKKVAIFHHASFLESQQKRHLFAHTPFVAVGAKFSSPLFPAGFVDETLQTLKLLFPGTDEDAKRWLKKIARSQKLDINAGKCGRLKAEDRHIEKFKFWHDRLIILKQVFDETEPSTLSQWWCDRRKRVQWYTFWVAVMVLTLTIFFGLVQSIEGALQAYKAFHPSK